MKKVFIILIIYNFWGVSHLHGQAEQKADSLINLLQNASDRDSVKYLLQIGDLYFQSENYPTALDYYFITIKLAERLGDLTGAADAANDVGRVYYQMENFTQSLEYFNKAKKYFEQTGDDQKMGGTLNNIALIYYELDSLDQAIDYYDQALAIKKKYKDTLHIGAINHNMGLVYIMQKKYDEAIEHLTSSKKIFEKLGYDKHVANATNNIGRAYYKSGRPKEALKYYKEGLMAAKKVNSAFLIMDNYKYQSDSYAKLGDFRKAYSYTIKHYLMKDSLLNIEKSKELAEIQKKYENEITEQENRILKKENEANAAIIKMQNIIGVAIGVITMLAGILAVFFYRANENKRKANEQLRLQKEEIEEKNRRLELLYEEISKQNEEIKAQKKELEELNAIKDKLFSIISHEFRSPLNSLKGTLALLKAGALTDEEINKISSELTDKVNSTSIFLDNLLNWAKSQMQGVTPKPMEVDLKQITEENIQLLRSMADKKKVRIENKIEENCIIYFDPNMMNLILRNLISNAIKFSVRGGVIEIESEKDDKECIVSVKDNGIGISKENLDMLFKIQGFTTRGTANERGTGLGLYITKNFIESNGGKIWVESEENKGSKFSFTVPV